MRVDRLRHDKLRTVGRVGVEVLNGRIVKSAVGTAELHVKHTVACAAPVGIGVDSTRKGVDPALNAAAADPEWKFQKLGVGDIVYRNYLGYTVQEGIYGQAEYTILGGKLNTVLSGALNDFDMTSFEPLVELALRS